MNITNIRLGFASNSSSSHSLIFLPNQRDDLKGTDDYMAYGWGTFTLASKGAKRQYLAAQIWPSLDLPDELALLVLRSLFEADISLDKITSEHGLDMYVDHASQWTVPRDWTHSHLPDVAFVKELCAYLDQKDLVVLGGNDNNGHHPLRFSGSFKLPIADAAGPLVARKDGHFWVLFNRGTGTKVRFSFDDLKRPYTKATVPELVDIKITDFCDRQCKFCYQDSSVTGKHANDHYFYQITETLASLRVFEVAIGGGEPMSHPQIGSFIKELRQAGVVPNITTRRTNWLRDPKLVRTVFDNVGRVAFSCEHGSHARQFLALVESAGISRDKVGIHVIPELTGAAVLEDILAVVGCDVAVTLLGLKRTGRGKELGKYDIDKPDCWIEPTLRQSEHRWTTVGIDTTLAKSCHKELKALKVDERFYDTKDGKFSMYLDLVRPSIGPSSYVSPEELIRLPERGSWSTLIQQHFDTW
jgi:hypothetical protein